MKKKLLATLLTAAMTATLLVGCGGSAEEAAAPAADAAPAAAEEKAEAPAADAADAGSGTLKIGFSQYASYNNWRVTNTDDINRALNEQGWNVIFADANDDTAQQISDLEDMIAQKPDYIVLAPREEEGYANVLEEAKEAGIKVILFDRLAKDAPYDVLIQGDYVLEGENVGQAVVDTFGEDKEINIVELTGTPGADVTAQRSEGFMNVISKHPNYKILASQVGNFSRTESQTAMENLIQSYGDKIDVVYAHSDDNGIGAINAIEAAGLKAGEDIQVFGVDGTKDGLQAIIDGKMKATYLCNPFYGDAIVGLIKDLESGKTFSDRVILEGKVYNIDNAQASLDAGEGF
ncbi:MAG: ABC transporter substrate-binding protein [Lachnospiraceae bacterium]|nr:ABC transporter substrate-binding protein [Lachnospiraceae bacterium]